MASSPNYSGTQRIAYAQWASAVNNALDGTGTLTQLVAGGSSGSVVKSLRFQGANSGNNPCFVNLFLSYDGGTTKALVHQLWFEGTSGYGISGGNLTESCELADLGWVLPDANTILYMAAGDSSSLPINGFAFLEDF